MSADLPGRLPALQRSDSPGLSPQGCQVPWAMRESPGPGAPSSPAPSTALRCLRVQPASGQAAGWDGGEKPWAAGWAVPAMVPPGLDLQTLVSVSQPLALLPLRVCGSCTLRQTTQLRSPLKARRNCSPCISLCPKPAEADAVLWAPVGLGRPAGPHCQHPKSHGAPVPATLQCLSANYLLPTTRPLSKGLFRPGFSGQGHNDELLPCPVPKSFSATFLSVTT